jgi:CBS domain-containing protein
MTVKTILSGKGTNVVTIEPNADLAAAVMLLAEKRIGALVVIGAEGRLIGILSERDIVRALAKHDAAALELPLTEAMTRKVVTCVGSETLSVVMERMTEGKFRHVPVVEGDRLVGIVSIGDVVKRRLEEMEREQSALREYIATA